MREPPSKGLRFAAVSVIIRDRESPGVLLIQRADRAGDPWSGQIAFPGGKTQPGDRTPRDTAIRETFEEVGVDLNRSGGFLGYGEVTTTHTGAMDVVPAVFELRGEVEVKLNEEAASYRWVGLHELFSPAARSVYELGTQLGGAKLPAYRVGGYVVWGLTYRILDALFGDSQARPGVTSPR
ncbi:MAG: CoA pyrophosphatase [Nitrososphaerota archaeon]|nr:CoA pyrophosphatase [Nitrososphaerota archaeon]